MTWVDYSMLGLATTINLTAFVACSLYCRWMRLKVLPKVDRLQATLQEDLDR